MMGQADQIERHFLFTFFHSKKRVPHSKYCNNNMLQTYANSNSKHPMDQRIPRMLRTKCAESPFLQVSSSRYGISWHRVPRGP